MRKVIAVLVGITLLSETRQLVSQEARGTSTLISVQRLGQQPIGFTENVGRWNERALIRASAGGAEICDLDGDGIPVCRQGGRKAG